MGLDDICRLCLDLAPSPTMCGYSANHKVLHYTDPNIEDKIKTFLLLNLEYHPLLPKQICNLCLDKINETVEFHKKVKQNQAMLLDHLKTDRISYLYLQLKNKIKKEPDSLNKECKINGSDFVESNEDIKIEFENTETYTSDDEVLSKVKEDEIITETKIPQITPIVKSHKCLTCLELFDTQTNLIKHYKTDHNDKKDIEKLDEYTIVKTEREIAYKCTVCSKEYSTKKNINRHMVRHSDVRPFLCKLCGRTYKTVPEIIRHGRVHSDSKLFCAHQCGYSTAYLGALRSHEKRHGKTRSKYECEKCGKGFEVRTWYEQHQNVHSGLKPFICSICGLAFHMDRYLTAHRSTVHPQSSSLKRYVCVHCSLPCDSKKALTEHLKIHGVVKTKFLCDLCGETLSNAEQLKFHKRTHLGEKPFSCSTCNKSFTKKFNLRVHERAHSGERAHVCTRCGRKYSQRSALRRHQHRNHAGTEPVNCSKCHQSFSSKQLHNVHQKICTPSID